MAKKDQYAEEPETQGFSLLGLHLADAKDPEVLPDFTESEWRVETCSLAPTKAGGNMIKVMEKALNQPPQTKPLFLQFVIPDSTHSEQAQYMMKLKLRQWLEGHGYPADFNGNITELVGAVAWGVTKGVMGKDRDNRDTGEMQHELVRWIKSV